MSESIISADHAQVRARVPGRIPLVVVLRGPGDPGGVLSQLDEYFWKKYEPEEVVRFSADLLLDYRARRPVMSFNEHHFTEYSPEKLRLCLVHDDLEAPFLLLSGFEPDFRWEQFVDTLLMLVHEFQVSTTVFVNGIPMPVPHTRPISMTVSGNRDDLIETRSTWRPITKMSGTLTHLFEYRLREIDEEVAGFSLLVPHYLANSEYPEALYAALDAIMAATGVFLETEEVREYSREFTAQLDSQLVAHGDTSEIVKILEQRYDAFIQGQKSPPLLIDEDEVISMADRLAGELERYLAQQQRDRDGSGPGEEPADES